MSIEDHVALNATLLIIFVLGLLANIVVISIILLLREYKESTFHRYVLQLAVADCMFLLTIPFKVAGSLHEEDWTCTASNTLQFVNYYASILLLQVMSMNRYIAVCHPFSKFLRSIRKGSVVLSIIISVWIIAILLSVPAMMYSVRSQEDDSTCKCSIIFPLTKNRTAFCIEENITEPEALKNCTAQAAASERNIKICKLKDVEDVDDEDDFDDLALNFSDYDSYVINYYFFNISKKVPLIYPDCSYKDHPMSWSIYLMFNFLALFVLPLIIMAVFYGLIVLDLKKKEANKRNSTRCQATNVRDHQDRRHVTIMCAALVGAFLICWLPFHATHVAKIIGIRSTSPLLCNILPVVVTTLTYFNSALNPYLYTFLGSRFIEKIKLVGDTPEIRWISKLFCCKMKTLCS